MSEDKRVYEMHAPRLAYAEFRAVVADALWTACARNGYTPTEIGTHNRDKRSFWFKIYHGNEKNGWNTLEPASASDITLVTALVDTDHLLDALAPPQPGPVLEWQREQHLAKAVCRKYFESSYDRHGLFIADFSGLVLTRPKGARQGPYRRLTLEIRKSLDRAVEAGRIGSYALHDIVKDKVSTRR